MTQAEPTSIEIEDEAQFLRDCADVLEFVRKLAKIAAERGYALPSRIAIAAAAEVRNALDLPGVSCPADIVSSWTKLGGVRLGHESQRECPVNFEDKHPPAQSPTEAQQRAHAIQSAAGKRGAAGRLKTLRQRAFDVEQVKIAHAHRSGAETVDQQRDYLPPRGGFVSDGEEPHVSDPASDEKARSLDKPTNQIDVGTSIEPEIQPCGGVVPAERSGEHTPDPIPASAELVEAYGDPAIADAEREAVTSEPDDPDCDLDSKPCAGLVGERQDAAPSDDHVNGVPPSPSPSQLGEIRQCIPTNRRPRIPPKDSVFVIKDEYLPWLKPKEQKAAPTSSLYHRIQCKMHNEHMMDLSKPKEACPCDSCRERRRPPVS